MNKEEKGQSTMPKQSCCNTECLTVLLWEDHAFTSQGIFSFSQDCTLWSSE